MNTRKPRQGKPQLRVIGVESMKVILKGHKLKADALTPNDLKYFKDLHSIVDQVYETAAETYGWTWAHLSCQLCCWMETHDRHVALDKIQGVTISTVFLGLDHRFTHEEDSPPILWETMIFCDEECWAGRFNDYQRRYSSLEAAKAGHKEAVGKITYVLN